MTHQRHRLHRAPAVLGAVGRAGDVLSSRELDAEVERLVRDTTSVLRAAGAELQHVVAASAYLTRPDWRSSFEASLRRHLPEPRFAGSLVLVPRLPDDAACLLRLTASADVDARGSAGAASPATPVFGAAVVRAGLYSMASVSSDDGAGLSKVLSVKEHVRVALTNLRAALASVGCGLDDVVSARLYVDDISELPLINEAYRDLFASAVPVRTTLGVLPCEGRGRIQIAAVAVDPTSGADVHRAAPSRSGVLVPAIRVNDDVWLSGIAGFETGGIEAQARESMQKCGRVLGQLGLSFDAVVDAEVALADLRDLAVVARVLGTYLPAEIPRTTFQAAGLVGQSGVEITLAARA